MSMTRRSIIVGIEGGGGRVRAETRTMIDYARHHRREWPRRSWGPFSLECVLDFEHNPSRTPVAELIFGCCLLFIIRSAAGPSKVFLYTGSSFIKYK